MTQIILPHYIQLAFREPRRANIEEKHLRRIVDYRVNFVNISLEIGKREHRYQKTGATRSGYPGFHRVFTFVEARINCSVCRMNI